MSIPPMSLKMTTGSFRRPSQVTAAKYSWATGARCSTSTPRGSWSLMRSARMSRAAASASSGVWANLTPPAFMRPPVRTCDLRTSAPPSSAAIVSASAALRATRPFGRGARSSAAPGIGAALARQAETAGERLQSLATALRDALPADGAAALMAGGVESARSYLGERDVEDIGKDMVDFVRRYPLQALLFG